MKLEFDYVIAVGGSAGCACSWSSGGQATAVDIVIVGGLGGQVEAFTHFLLPGCGQGVALPGRLDQLRDGVQPCLA